MTRLAPLYKIESFRETVAEILDLDDQSFAALSLAAQADMSATFTDRPMQSNDELTRRAMSLLYEAAVRDGVADVELELRAAIPEADEPALDRLLKALTPGDDDLARVTGIEERDAFMPILTGHRLALDLRITETQDGTPVATPFVTARFDFDANIGAGANAAVFQLNLADIEALIQQLFGIRERAQRLIAGPGDMTIPGWAHGLPSD